MTNGYPPLRLARKLHRLAGWEWSYFILYPWYAGIDHKIGTETNKRKLDPLVNLTFGEYFPFRQEKKDEF